MKNLFQISRLIIFIQIIAIGALNACPICHSKKGSVKYPYFHETNIAYHAKTYNPHELSQL